MNAISETAGRFTVNGAFVTTRWSLVVDAQAESPLAQGALEELCRIYWRPIFSFLRREGKTVEDAQDLTQSFFAQLLERGDFAAVRREKGRLRSYLLGSLKHFLANDRRHAMALKRGAGRTPISFDYLRSEDGADPEDGGLSPDRVYDRRWALTVLDRVFARLNDESNGRGNAELCERLNGLLSDEPDRPTHAEIACEFGMTENAVKQAFHRLRERYRQLLREEVAHTVATPADVENELRDLMVALRA